jgi:tripartite-type tricarboxylate transporter receptor subunit TctC
MYLGTGVEVTNHIKAGTLRPLGISSAQRSPIAPDIPTIAESGLPAFVVDVWFGVLAPTGTPRPIIDKLNKVIVDVVNTKEVQEGLLQNNSVPAPSTPEEFQARIKADLVKWGKVVKESGAKAN